jgi:hypothetical protein
MRCGGELARKMSLFLNLARFRWGKPAQGWSNQDRRQRGTVSRTTRCRLPVGLNRRENAFAHLPLQEASFMCSRSALSFALVALFAAELPAAPAPFGDTRAGTAQAILAAETPERIEIALRYLRWEGFLDAVLQSSRVRDLACLKGVKDRRAWLRARLEVQVKGTDSLVIRLNDCRLSDALEFLRVALDQVARKPQSTSFTYSPQNVRLERHMIARMRARLLRMAGADPEARARARKIDHIEHEVDRIDLATNPLQVKRGPARAAR